MSTHYAPCVVCGKETPCTSDAHALGCGDGGCGHPGPVIEFCSYACFKELRRRMDERERIALSEGHLEHLGQPEVPA